MGQPGRKAAKSKAVKKAKGGSMMKPPPKMAKGGSMMKPKPPGMKGGGGVDDPTLPDGKFGRGGRVKKKVTPRKNTRQVDPTVPDESGGRKLKPPPNPGAAKLPKTVRNKMGFMKNGGSVKKSKGGAMMKPPPKMAKGGSMYKKGKKDGPKP
jgi:hypothetical protein